MNDRAAVTVCGLLTIVLPERDRLPLKLALGHKSTAQAILNECAAREREVEAISVLDSAQTLLLQVCICFMRFREWLSSSMPALLDIFHSIVERLDGRLPSIPHLPITRCACSDCGVCYNRVFHFRQQTCLSLFSLLVFMFGLRIFRGLLRIKKRPLSSFVRSRRRLC